jgi:hypothetical protein
MTNAPRRAGLWGTPQFKALLDGISVVRLPVTGLHNLIERVPPVVAKPTAEAIMAPGCRWRSRPQHQKQIHPFQG